MFERFVDTSGWAAWIDSREQFHGQALVALDEVWNQGGFLVTTNYVLTELTALLSRLRIANRSKFSSSTISTPILPSRSYTSM